MVLFSVFRERLDLFLKCFHNLFVRESFTSFLPTISLQLMTPSFCFFAVSRTGIWASLVCSSKSEAAACTHLPDIWSNGGQIVFLQCHVCEFEDFLSLLSFILSSIDINNYNSSVTISACKF